MVKTAREFLATFDAEGTFEGVPFMPEMLESCGETFRVRARRKECQLGRVQSGISEISAWSSDDQI
jgi:hypothetical protein